MKRARPAPRDWRTASSRSRPAARASTRFATLTHTINSTSATTARSTLVNTVTAMDASGCSIVAE